MNIEKLSEYRATLEEGLSQKDYIQRVAEEINKKQNCDNIFLVGCGGSLMVMNPSKYICEVNSEINLFIYNASEFYTVKPSALSNRGEA